MAFADAGVPALARFWARVERHSDEECWLWTGSVSGGYGRIRVDGQRVNAHRFSYEVVGGCTIPDGHVVDHQCDNKRCVNPAHLKAMTSQENTLRGPHPSAVACRTNVCVSGRHELTGGNVRVRSSGKRECRACARESRAAYRIANRDKINAQKRAGYHATKGGG